jgi:apolipoprotein N-acyltransferase
VTLSGTLTGRNAARRSLRTTVSGEQAGQTPPRHTRPWGSSRRGRATLAVLAGLAGFLAFPPVGWWPAAFVSVAAFTLLCRDTSKRLAYAFGGLYGLALFIPLLTWIRTLGALAWLLLSVTQALELGVLALGLRAVSRLRLWPLYSAGVWVLEEALRGR